MFSVVKVVVIEAVIREIIARPTIIQLMANKRPSRNLGHLSPYLYWGTRKPLSFGIREEVKALDLARDPTFGFEVVGCMDY